MWNDAAITVPIGPVGPEVHRLLDVTKAALFAGVEQMRHGNRLGDVSSTIQRTVEIEGFSIIRTLVGHGIGRDMHEDPQVPNFRSRSRGMSLAPGICLAIEPMLTLGSEATRTLGDGWTVVTQDGSLAAHFEHTIAVTEDGHEVLTAR